LIDGLYELEPTKGDDGDLCPGRVGLSWEAKDAYVAFYNAHGIEQAELAGELSAVWSKLEEYSLRLALVIHFARWAADQLLVDDRVIDVASMTAGIRLTTWFKGEARRVYSLLSESDEDRDRRSLVEWIDRKGGTVTARDVQSGCRSLKAAGEADAALKDLVKRGYGQWQDVPTGSKGGRPTRVFKRTEVSTVNTTAEFPANGTGFVDADDAELPEFLKGDADVGDEPESLADNDEWGDV
jgi:hypothetical protein